ncbi:MAG: hypothetical protein J5497_08225, partial [Selenomonadaceae bacterium]|nr:hypothetical protein [Selenomonadaceae bacterium]
MGIWEITNPVASLSKDASQSSYRQTSKSGGFASEYSKILAEKIANIKTDVRAMEAVQEQLNEIRDLQEELTGEVKVDEDSGNANRDDGNTSTITCVEKIKRFLPDGSVMVTTYEDGKITDRIKLRPNMTVVPDYTAPPEPDGSVANELKPTHSLE